MAKGRRLRQLNTHCSNGHLYTPETVKLHSNNHRQCLICRPVDKERTKEYSTHCSRGHIYTEETTRLKSDGRRQCLLCPNWKSNLTHCKRGHAFTFKNTMWRADGKRRCRRCHASFQLRYQRPEERAGL